MKKILLFLLLVFPIVAKAQLELPFSIKLVNSAPIDFWYFESDGTPYDNTTEVTTQVLSAIRYRGQTFNVNGVEYWFGAGITDPDLVVKLQSPLTFSNGLTESGGSVTASGDAPYINFYNTTGADSYNFELSPIIFRNQIINGSLETVITQTKNEFTIEGISGANRYSINVNGVNGISFDFPTNATGDTYHRGSSTYYSRLPIGGSGQVYTVGGSSVPIWEDFTTLFSGAYDYSGASDGDLFTISSGVPAWVTPSFEDVSNKATDLGTMNSTLYPTTASLFGRRDVTSADAIVQTDNGKTIVFNSGTPFNFTLDAMTAETTVYFLNKGSATVTFVNGSGVTLVGTATLAGSNSTAAVYYESSTGPIISSGGGSGGSGLIVGTSTITSGTNGYGFYNNSGVLGEFAYGTGVRTFLTTPSWTNFNSAITGTAPFYSLASGGTATGTNTFAMGTNPFILTSGVTTGTGATAGFQRVYNSLTSGNGDDLSSSSYTNGAIQKITSTSTAINNTISTNGVSQIAVSGAMASSRIAIGQNISVTTTGTTSKNVGLVLNTSGATDNIALLVPTGNIGVGGNFTPSSIFHIQTSGTSVTNRVESTNSNSSVTFSAKAGGGVELLFGQYGTTKSAYGAIGSGYGYLYTGGNLAFAVDNASGAIKFGIGSSVPEVAKITTTGMILGSSSVTGDRTIKATNSATTADLILDSDNYIKMNKYVLLNDVNMEFASSTGNNRINVSGSTGLQIFDNNLGVAINNSNGSFDLIDNISTLTGNTTLVAQGVVLVDATSGNITITLPAAASNVKREYTIQKIDSSINTVTVDANASEVINGALTQVLATQYAFIKIKTNGTEWYIIAK